MSLPPRHRHIISDFEDRRPAPLWPWVLALLLMFGLAAACGAIFAGNLYDEGSWRPLWAGIVAVVALLIAAAMVAALYEERREAQEAGKQLIRALRGAYGLPESTEKGRRRAD